MIAKTDVSAMKAFEIIQEISETLASVQAGSNFPYFVVRRVADVIDVTRCSIVRLTPKQPLGYVVASHDAPRLSNMPIDLHKYPEIGAVRDTREAVVINDIPHSRLLAPCRDHLRQTPYTAIMAVPMLSCNQAIGVLSLRSSRKTRGFSRYEVEFCRTVANLVSLSEMPLTHTQTPPGRHSACAMQHHLWSEELISASPQMQTIRDIINRLSNVSEPVLILGESGVGKENIARALHASSSRWAKPFVKINCAALPIDLLESELFGYERGAFTGAYRQKPGKFELAHGGTIFLDEIGDLHGMLQAKLLQVLQEGQFARLGGCDDVKVDVWVLAATNKNLEAEVAAGNFRQDLYYRLNVISLSVPPLRQRRQDIIPLVEHFLDLYNAKYKERATSVSKRLLSLFQQYDWPGNVRELENTIKRLVVLEDEDPLIAELLGRVGAVESMSSEVRPDLSLKEIVKAETVKAECEAIRRALNQTNWNRRKAAQRLSVSYRSLQYKMKAYKLMRDSL